MPVGVSDIASRIEEKSNSRALKGGIICYFNKWEQVEEKS
jgi:hypothetical protein